MTDPSSPIAEFYPPGMCFFSAELVLFIVVLSNPCLSFSFFFRCADFEIDMNGKRYSWQV